MPTEPGPLGVWTFTDAFTAEQSRDFAQKLEHWGYSTLWLPEAVGRDPFAIIAHLAASTSKLVFATGIANIYARDPMTMTAIRNTLGDLAPGRFIMGLGVSHAHLVSGLRGHEYKKPVTTRFTIARFGRVIVPSLFRIHNGCADHLFRCRQTR